ncbi:hypothetical protein ACX80H_00415 [Arthrobacter sp. MDT2-2]|jgi:hypothetical protein
MDQTLQHRFSIVPIIALGMVLGGWAAFLIVDRVGFISEAAEYASTLLWLVGWVAIAWALMLVGAQFVHFGLLVRTRGPIALWDVFLTGATALLLYIVIAGHPLWGEGTGFGGQGFA